jgi:hypothetical protein
VPVANRLGDEGIGFKIAMAGLDGGRINIAACSLGGAQSALDKSLAYMKERKAFGKRSTNSRRCSFASPTWRPNWRRRGPLSGARRRRSTARSRTPPCCARWPSVSAPMSASRSPTRRCKLHGGYGYLSEYGIEKIVRDLRVHQILEGTNEIMRLIVSRKLIEGAR